MTAVALGMPHTDVAGLSEHWLFKHCGEEHWARVFAAVGAGGVDSLRGGAGERLYPTFVAVRARYTRPLSAARLDERFRTTVALAHYGRAFFRSRVGFASARMRCSLEMLTAFVARDQGGRNALHQALPPGDLPYRAARLARPPALLKTAQSIRRGAWEGYSFGGSGLPEGGEAVELSRVYEPSPYRDYNGAGLLYFASYTAIADTLERGMVAEAGVAPGEGDWALRSSTVARDVFYHRNLDLGERLVATLRRVEPRGDTLSLHTRLTAERGGAVLADVFTAKRLVPAVRRDDAEAEG